MDEGGTRDERSGGGTGDLFGNSCEESANQPLGGRRSTVPYVGKYSPLRRYLEGLEESGCELQFNQVEEIIGSELPRSAWRRRTGWLWWTNDPSRTQAKNGWLAAGWFVSSVDYDKSVVYLGRGSR